MICPCRGCKDRNMKCHAVCEKYKTWREELDRLNSEYKAKHNYGDEINYTVRRDARIKRRLGIK